VTRATRTGQDDLFAAPAAPSSERAADGVHPEYRRGVADAVAALRNLDRTGREWVRGSLWANIFQAGIAAVERLVAREAMR